MTTLAGTALTNAHYRQQLSIRAQAIRDAHALWQTWTPGSYDSWRAMLALALPLIQHRHGLSSAAAQQYFQRMAAFETGKYDPGVSAGGLPDEQVEHSLAATGLVGTLKARKAGLSEPAAAQAGFVQFQGGLTRLVLLGGRDALVASVAASSTASGWRRVTSGNPCSFCEGLADEVSTPEAFQAHDNCSCTAEPTFG